MASHYHIAGEVGTWSAELPAPKSQQFVNFSFLEVVEKSGYIDGLYQ
jgi:hypothetical protein